MTWIWWAPLMASLIGGSYHFWAAIIHRRRARRWAARADSR